MPSLSFIFNKVQVANPSRTLSLSVDSSVWLHCINRDLPRMTCTHMLDLVDSGNIWITHGNGYRIDFSLNVDGKREEWPFIDEVIKDLGAYVRDAPLWSQLLLDAKIEHPEKSLNEDSRHTFSVFLTPVNFMDLSSDSRSPKLSASHGVQIPASVACFQLRKIKIFMTYFSGSADQAHQTLPTPMPFDGAKDDFIKLTLNPESDDLIFRKHEIVHKATSSPYVHVAIPMLTTHALANQRLVLDIPLHSQEEELEDKQIDHGRTSFALDLHCAQEMAHQAFQKLLVGQRQNGGQAGIKILSGRPALTLSKLAPSLFIPGFYKALSQRAWLIPGLSHVFSTSLLRNAQSPSLRRKLLSLSLSLASQPENNSIEDSVYEMNKRSEGKRLQTSATLGRLIEERLWAMTQRSLYRPPSTRNVLLPNNKDNRMCRESSAGPVNIFAAKTEEEHHMKEDSQIFNDYNLDSPATSFEDLFEDMQDEEGEYDGPAQLFSDDTSRRNVDDGFEDLFKVKTPQVTSEASHARLMECEMEVDEDEEDDDFEAWESYPTTKTGDPSYKDYCENHNISHIEDEDMLL